MPYERLGVLNVIVQLLFMYEIICVHLYRVGCKPADPLRARVLMWFIVITINTTTEKETMTGLQIVHISSN